MGMLRYHSKMTQVKTQTISTEAALQNALATPSPVVIEVEEPSFGDGEPGCSHCG